jgi:hypothetical protein
LAQWRSVWPALQVNQRETMSHATYMKKLLLLATFISLVSTTGCIVPGGDRHDHARYEHHDAVIVGPPAIVVRPPEVIVR